MLIKTIVLLCLGSYVLTQSQTQSSSPYQFSYSTGQAGPAQMFRDEQRGADGSVTGRYGYVDPYGQLRIVQYEANKDGFLAKGDVGPDQEAMRAARQLALQDFEEKKPFMQYWNLVASRQGLPANWAKTDMFAKIRAQHPPKEQDWTSGQAVQSFMRSIGMESYPAAPLIAAPLVPEPHNAFGLPTLSSPSPRPGNTVFARYNAQSPNAPSTNNFDIPALPPAPAFPAAPQPVTNPITSNTNPIGSNFHFTVNHGGPEGYKYSVSY